MVLRNKFVSFCVQSDHDLSMFGISIVTEVDSRYSRACTVYSTAATGGTTGSVGTVTTEQWSSYLCYYTVFPPPAASLN